MLQLLALAEVQTQEINGYDHPLMEMFCVGFDDISYVSVAVTDEAGAQTTLYVQSQWSNCLRAGRFSRATSGTSPTTATWATTSSLLRARPSRRLQGPLLPDLRQHNADIPVAH